MMCYDATDEDGEMGEDGEVVAEDSKGDFKNWAFYNHWIKQNT